MIEIAPKWIEFAREKCNELMPQYADGRLPFVQIDAGDPGIIISAWNVAPTGSELDDLALGCIYADLLVRRAKNWRDHGDRRLGIDPFQIILEVLEAIAAKGNPGAIERGFLGRIAILALAALQN
jgi:hypothetical protein